MSQTELVRRREARQRKIMQNAENRLKKITGIEPKKCDLELNCVQDNVEILEEINENPIISNNDPTILYENYARPEIVQERQKDIKENYNNEIVVSLAILVNFLHLFGLSGLYLNKIFVPLLVYKVTSFYLFPHTSQKEGFLYFLVVSKVKSEKLIDVLLLISETMQNLMLYFFTFMCCRSVLTVI